MVSRIALNDDGRSQASSDDGRSGPPRRHATRGRKAVTLAVSDDEIRSTAALVCDLSVALVFSRHIHFSA